ncbi:hypothetical protein LB521_04415 [Mesorhizobium sp. BR-1-1-8]|uniref:hypothetical protein n=1 Tax=Mesorhizobium sp. BR-1-1-8 TaxID=2876659 RepID=UPI001CCDAF81|nr:hypothetical protein [Mesorhizobium sp. BR-1-1-8]MBZ9980390.1 hypothetical protein [Mesorhizobium sp. BR-1-1-8]
MAVVDDYVTGTVSVANGSPNVTGVGTAWTLAAIRPGDEFKRFGRSIAILSVTDDTHLVLAENWPDTALAGSAYRIRFQPDGSRLTAQAAAIVQALLNGNLDAIANLVGAADKVPYFTGAGVAALADFTTAGRALVAAADADGQLSELGFSTFMKGIINDPDASTALSTLGFSDFIKTLIGDPDASAALDTLGFSAFIKTLINDADAATARGTLGLAAVSASGSAADLGTGTLPNARVSATLTADKAFRQGNILATVAQSAGVPTGGIIERGSNANGQYVRYADGTQMCWSTFNGTTVAGNVNFAAINYPAAFSAVPNVSTDKLSSLATRFFTSVASPSATTITIGLGDTGAGGISINVTYIALGRWF